MSHSDITLWQQAEGIASGRLDPVELTETALAKAADSTSVFINILAERARFEAQQARARQQAGQRLSPIDGVPIAWKDLVDMSGTVTTAGSRLYQVPADRDADAVRLAGQAGLVSVGKVNMTELAYSGLGLNPHYGTPTLDRGGPARVPGGSSSGSAMAVAQGVVTAAVGSDTAGSLRIPAAFNGLVTYRPSMHRPAMGGVHPLSRSMDTLGVLARTLTDVMAVDDAMRLGKVEHRRAVDASDIRVILDTDALADPFISEAVRANLLAAAERFDAAGIRVIRRPVAAIQDALAAIANDGWLGGMEAYTEYKDLLDSRPASDFDPRVRDRLLTIKDATPDRVIRLYRARARLQAELAEQLDGALLISPTVAKVAPELAPLETDDALYAKVNLEALRLTMAASLLTCPAIALPTGTDCQGLPTSVQLTALPGDDERLIRSALTLESLAAG
ncbi:amidase family protein [Saccharospirillum sp. HFRX-1]|uniref:amidase family protein n=1 Tax=unclassified Saccharospirillum TaxID=2633430 RepID=UPI003722C709